MNRFKFPACKLRVGRDWRLAAAYLIGLTPAFSAFGGDEAGDQSILALVNVPAQNLPCDQAAAQASVSFQALNVPFAVRRISVFIDGAGLPESAVDVAWPSVVVNQGLHPGRNLVELILYGPDNQSMDRKQSVLIGTPPNYGDVAPAQIDCADTSDSSAGDDQTAPPISALDESDEPPADAAPPVDDSGPAYVEGPVYSYYPAPVFFGTGVCVRLLFAAAGVLLAARAVLQRTSGPSTGSGSQME